MHWAVEWKKTENEKRRKSMKRLRAQRKLTKEGLKLTRESKSNDKELVELLE